MNLRRPTVLDRFCGELLRVVLREPRYGRELERRSARASDGSSEGAGVHDCLRLGTRERPSARTQTRMKRAGQHWAMKNARRMARLRAAYRTAGALRFYGAIRRAH